MAIVATTLNGSTLPHPNAYGQRVEYLGAATTLADGSIRRDLLNTNAKRRFSFAWPKVTASDMTTIKSAYDAAVKGNVTLVTPDNQTVTVTAAPQPVLQFEGYASAQTMYWRVSMELWEV